jgi:hypothetical protein
MPSLDIKTDACPGRLNQIELNCHFKSNKIYSNIDYSAYRGQCSEFCGLGHGFMPIVIKAISQKSYFYYIYKYIILIPYYDVTILESKQIKDLFKAVEENGGFFSYEDNEKLNLHNSNDSDNSQTALSNTPLAENSAMPLEKSNDSDNSQTQNSNVPSGESLAEKSAMPLEKLNDSDKPQNATSFKKKKNFNSDIRII